MYTTDYKQKKSPFQSLFKRFGYPPQFYRGVRLIDKQFADNKRSLGIKCRFDAGSKMQLLQLRLIIHLHCVDGCLRRFSLTLSRIPAGGGGGCSLI